MRTILEQKRAVPGTTIGGHHILDPRVRAPFGQHKESRILIHNGRGLWDEGAIWDTLGSPLGTWGFPRVVLDVRGQALWRLETGLRAWKASGTQGNSGNEHTADNKFLVWRRLSTSRARFGRSCSKEG